MLAGTHSASFKINSPSIIWELIDSEVVAINLDTGHYFHLYKQASIVWLMIDQKFSHMDIIASFATHYQLPTNVISKDIKEFLQQLIDEQLITASEMGVDLLPVLEFAWSGFEGMDYSAPALEKHTDMTNLLLVDPVHEVDAHGWPNRHPLPQD